MADDTIPAQPVGNNANGQSGSGFTWIPFYKSLAKYIYDQKGNKDDIFRKVNDICTTMKLTTIGDDQRNPFAIYQKFNSNLNDQKRCEFIRRLNEQFSLNASIPTGFHGIPVLTQHKEYAVKKGDNEVLWDLFEEAMNFKKETDAKPESSSGIRETNFGKALNIDNNGIGKITMGLFWIAPDLFINLDNTNRPFIKKEKMFIEKAFAKKNIGAELLDKLDNLSWQEYLSFCKGMQEFVGKDDYGKRYGSLAAFSHEANQYAERNALKSLLMNNGQVILHGAPGTGKTFAAEQIAESIVTEGLTPDQMEVAMRDHFKSVQFHPGYDYSDFIVGMKPMLVSEDGHEVIPRDGGLVKKDTNEPYEGKVGQSFKWEDGIFKQIADAALDKLKKYPDNPPKFVLVIDEINRADLSNVFGEVFSCMEQGYRYRYKRNRKTCKIEKDQDGKPIVLKYKATTLPSKTELIVPENLYIIGTMNDIDKSVESIDIALRRRFAWKEVDVGDSKGAILESKGFDSDDYWKLSNAMDALNDALTSPSPGLELNKAHQLGATYFANLELYPSPSGRYTDSSYESLWNNHIVPILTEYLRGQDPDGKKLDALKDAYSVGVKPKKEK